MKIKTLLLPIVIIFSIAACKKEVPQITSPDIIPETYDYLPLTVGNYWYYDNYRVNDTTGIEEQMDIGDTVKIIAEEVINGETYFAFEQKKYWLSSSNAKDTIYYRDSSGYIVNLEGEIIFSYVDFNNILRFIDHNVHATEYSVSDSIEIQIVPAGIFECLNFKGRFYPTSPGNMDDPERFIHNCYAKDVGLIFETAFFSANFESHFERRLSEYHIE